MRNICMDDTVFVDVEKKKPISIEHRSLYLITTETYVYKILTFKRYNEDLCIIHMLIICFILKIYNTHKKRDFA